MLTDIQNKKLHLIAQLINIEGDSFRDEVLYMLKNNLEFPIEEKCDDYRLKIIKKLSNGKKTAREIMRSLNLKKIELFEILNSMVDDDLINISAIKIKGKTQYIIRAVL